MQPHTLLRWDHASITNVSDHPNRVPTIKLGGKQYSKRLPPARRTKSAALSHWGQHWGTRGPPPPFLLTSHGIQCMQAGTAKIGAAPPCSGVFRVPAAFVRGGGACADAAACCMLPT